MQDHERARWTGMGGGVSLCGLMRDAQSFQDRWKAVGFYAQSGGQIGRCCVVVAECELVQFCDAAFCDVEAQARLSSTDPAELPADLVPWKGDATGRCRAVRRLAMQGVEQSQKIQRARSEQGRAEDREASHFDAVLP